MATHIYREKISQNPNQTTQKYEEKIIDEAGKGDTVIYTNANPAAKVIYLLLDIAAALLAIRFVLRLLAASAASPFVRFMYAITDPLVAPFRGIFANFAIGNGGIIDWASVAAMIIYALIAYLVVQLIYASTRPVAR